MVTAWRSADVRAVRRFFPDDLFGGRGGDRAGGAWGPPLEEPRKPSAASEPSERRRPRRNTAPDQPDRPYGLRAGTRRDDARRRHERRADVPANRSRKHPCIPRSPADTNSIMHTAWGQPCGRFGDSTGIHCGRDVHAVGRPQPVHRPGPPSTASPTAAVDGNPRTTWVNDHFSTVSTDPMTNAGPPL